MKIRVDYHFHPGFPFFIPVLGKLWAKRKAKIIWKEFSEYKLDAIIITEHAYKHPKKTFEYLEKFRPKNAKTLIIPGVEALTKEGTDLIVFAKNKKDIYSFEELLIPKKFNTVDLIKFVKKNPKLHGIVTHPYLPGTTGIISTNGMDVAKYAVKELGMVEAYNCSFTVLISLIDFFKLNKIFKKKYAQIKNTAVVPETFYNDETILTGGSDAHHIGEIGDYMEINISKKDDLFKIITSKSGSMIVQNKKIRTLILNIVTVSREWLIKKTHLYTIDKLY